MKKLIPNSDEFYIGYVSSSPETVAVFIKKIIRWGVVGIALIGSALAISQHGFTTSEFEYGVNTSLTGALINSPVPHLRISLGKNVNGEELFQSVLLVGTGKHGFGKHFPNLGHVTMKGFLIYGDGKALLQVNNSDDISAIDKGNTLPSWPYEKNNCRISVTGEITDPKCYFGVMKPGEGKLHRSCAIRCIAGGIPAVFKTNSSDYFLLFDENMQSLNSEVLSIVGDQISLEGEIVALDDWKILQVDSKKVRILAGVEQQKKLLALDKEMTFCTH